MRLIDADRLPSAEVNGIRGIKFIPKDFIDIAPTVDAVPVVRCKDCKYWDDKWHSSAGNGFHYCPMIDLVTHELFYCSIGELQK